MIKLSSHQVQVKVKCKIKFTIVWLWVSKLELTTKEAAPGLCLFTSHLRLVFFKLMSNLVISPAPIRETAPFLLTPVATPFLLATVAHALALRVSAPLNSIWTEKTKIYGNKKKRKKKKEDCLVRYRKNKITKLATWSTLRIYREQLNQCFLRNLVTIFTKLRKIPSNLRHNLFLVSQANLHY